MMSSPPNPPPCAPCPRPCMPPPPCPCPPPPCQPCPLQPRPPPAPNPPPPCPAPCAVNCWPPSQGDYCRAMEKQKRKEYRTKYKCTVESWRPGCTKVVCPCCGCEAQPVIRRQRNQLASSSLGACLMLGCWPLSFLPFMLCESTVVNLYCAQCNNFLGAYNRKEGCIVDVEAQLCNPGVVPNFPSIPH
ncbi:uncharacterized protein LOC128995347 [Macrosteles quadrilineatus]|nr:uncharacterized protein LOC128995347 [Macrosteles quadrilineatus]